MSLTEVLLQSSCSSDRIPPHEPSHMLSGSNGLVRIGRPAPLGSHHPWLGGNSAEEPRPGVDEVNWHELREPVIDSEPAGWPIPPLRPMSSSIKDSGENEQPFIPDFASEPQSFELRSLTNSRAGETNLLNPTSSFIRGVPNDSLVSERDIPQPQRAVAPPSTPTVEKSFSQRFTGVFGRGRPAPAASGHPVTERAFQIDAVRLIKENRYDAYKEAVHTSLETEWHNSIHQKLRKNVEAVIQGIGLQPKEMAVYVSLSMVGPKVGDMLHLLPTIVILCAHKKAKMKIEQLVNSGQLDYLREFACPHLVCIRGREPKHRDRFFAGTDSYEEMNSFGGISQYDLSLQRQKSISFVVEQAAGLKSACGLKIEFIYSFQDGQYDNYLRNGRFKHERHTMARIGGIVYIGEKAFAMTTAHAFLLHEPGQGSDAGNDSDSTTDTNSDPELSVHGNYEEDSTANHEMEVIQNKTIVWLENDKLSGSFAFCDRGRRFDCPDSVTLMSPNSDWCTLSMDSINGLTNHYRAENEKRETVEVSVDEMDPEEIVKYGDVHILNSSEKPMLAYMTQTMASIYFGGKSLNVRRLITKYPLSAGLSGCWVIRGKQLLGHIVGGNEFERSMYMVGIQDTRRAIEELTGEIMSLKPKDGMEASVKEPYLVNLENPRSESLGGLLTGMSEVVEDAKSIGHSDSVILRDDSRTDSATSRDTAQLNELELRELQQQFEDGKKIRRFLEVVNNGIVMGLCGPHLETEGPFVPLTSIMEFFADPAFLGRVLEELWPGETAPVRENEILNGYVRVFTILLSLGKGTLIHHFVQHQNLADALLPFENRPHNFPKIKDDSDFFHDFHQHQWKFCPYVFNRGVLQSPLHPLRVLPITEKVHIADGKNTQIYRVHILAEYDNLGTLPKSEVVTLDQPPHTYALKCYPAKDGPQVYQDNMQAFSHSAKFPTDCNIIQFHSGFQVLGGSQNALFQYADGGTLEEYFGVTPSPSLLEDKIEIWRALFRLLKAVADKRDLRHSNSGDTEDFTRHRSDIRPKNILVIKKRSGSLYDVDFVLADPGRGQNRLSNVAYGKMKAISNTTSNGSTQEYAPPEIDEESIRRPQWAQSAEVWSLGCVFSEAIVWADLFMPGLDAYREEREATTQDLDVARRSFHDGHEVLSIVDHWHADVAARVDAPRDLVTLPLLNMIEDMLGPLPRPSASTLWYKSRRILQGALRSSESVDETSNVSNTISYHSVEQTTSRWKMLRSAGNRPARRSSNSSSNPSAPTTVFSDTKEEFSSIESSSFYHNRSEISSSVVLAASPESSLDTPAINTVATGAVGFQEQSLVPKMLSTLPRESQRHAHHSRVVEDGINSEIEGPKDKAAQLPNVGTLPMIRIERFKVTREQPPQLPVSTALKWLKGKRDSYLPRHELLNRLKERDHVFLVDDSSSMRPHWKDVAQLLTVLSYMVKGLDRDGLDLHFTMSSRRMNEASSTKLVRHVERAHPGGASDIDLSLDRILNPYLEQLMSNKAPRRNWLLPRNFARPLNIYVLTDGVWLPDSDGTRSIKAFVAKLHELGIHNPAKQIGIQFIQFGNDRDGAKKLQHLDSDFATETLCDIVDTEPSTGNVWKMFLGSTNHFFDE